MFTVDDQAAGPHDASLDHERLVLQARDVEFDWATDRSVQAGQRTFASMTAARCATVWEDESNTPLPIILRVAAK